MKPISKEEICQIMLKILIKYIQVKRPSFSMWQWTCKGYLRYLLLICLRCIITANCVYIILQSKNLLHFTKHSVTHHINCQWRQQDQYTTTTKGTWKQKPKTQNQTMRQLKQKMSYIYVHRETYKDYKWNIQESRC